MRQGDIIEANATAYYHKQGIPFLVSEVLLRSYNLGQIDVCYLKKNKNKSWVLKIIEIKSSIYPSSKQYQRLKRTQDYLSKILELESNLEVKFCQKADHSLSF